MITWIAEKDLKDNGFYWRICKDRGKVVLIEIRNKDKMYKEALEGIKRLKAL